MTKVDVNPQLQVPEKAAEPASESPAGPAGEEISLTDLAQISNTNSGDASGIPSDPGPSAGQGDKNDTSQEVEKSTDVAPQGSNTEGQKDSKKPAAVIRRFVEFCRKLFGFVGSVVQRAKGALAGGFKHIFGLVRRGIQLGFQSLRARLLKPPTIKDRILGAFKWLSSTSKVQKLKLLLLIMVLAAIGIVVYGPLKIIKKSLRNFGSPTESLEPVADHVFELAPEEAKELEEFLNTQESFEDVVLLKKMVVNLKRSQNPNGNPMAAFELLLQVSSKDAAIEITQRQNEMRDITSRIAEEMDFDSLHSVKGKEKFKVLVRAQLNTAVNSGRVNAVFFKTLLVKP